MNRRDQLHKLLDGYGINSNGDPLQVPANASLWGLLILARAHNIKVWAEAGQVFVSDGEQYTWTVRDGEVVEAGPTHTR